MPETRTVARTGLVTAEKAPVPLAGVTIDVEITNSCARVAVAQRYVNTEDTPIEAVYLFPLDEGAAVCGFEAIIDGTLVMGEIREREEAFRLYDEALARGDGGFLLDEERPDVFQASIGNLPPGKEVLVKITYVTELTVDGRALRFAVPTTVAPRYAPAEDQRGVGRPDSDALNAPTGWRVPYGLTLSVRVAMTGAISSIESPSHPIAVTVNGAEAVVKLSQRDAALDRDFVLAVEAEALDVPAAWIERGDDGRHAIAVGFVPRLAATQVASEIIFVVDRSGSMDGTSIAEVRNALQLCLRSLTPGCCFNIVGFGSTTEFLFPASQAYDDNSLNQASKHVASLAADLGGTEILPALEQVLSAPRRGPLPRQLIVLTDGEVTNTDAVLNLARTHHADARIFTFGIGAGASHHLVKGLARAGGGAAEFIHPGERIEPKVLRLFGRLLSPAMTNVRIDWGGLRVTQAPSIVPPVFAGSRLLLYAFAEAPIVTATCVKLEADAGSERLALEVSIDPVRAVPGRTVATLAARARIRELEESPEWIAARGSRQNFRKQSAATREIIDLAMRYGLMSRETSYVAVERRETPIEGDIKLRRVPIALTAGWGGLEQRAMRRALADMDALSVALSAPPMNVPERASMSALRTPPRTAPGSSGAFGRSLKSLGAGWLQPQRAPESPTQRLILLQRADGSWDLTKEFADAIGQPLSALEQTLAGDASDAHARRAWATALALAWLDRYAANDREEWRLIAAKARRWLGAAEGSWAERARETVHA